MSNEELEKEHERLKNQFFRLLACLYPNQIGQQDAEYIIDGKKEGVKNTTVAKGCSTCKYETNPIPEEPCFSCIHGLCDENPNRRENWEAKNNG